MRILPWTFNFLGEWVTLAVVYNVSVCVLDVCMAFIKKKFGNNKVVIEIPVKYFKELNGGIDKTRFFDVLLVSSTKIFDNCTYTSLK